MDSNTVGWYQTTHLGQQGNPVAVDEGVFPSDFDGLGDTLTMELCLWEVVETHHEKMLQ